MNLHIDILSYWHIATTIFFYCHSHTPSLILRRSAHTLSISCLCTVWCCCIFFCFKWNNENVFTSHIANKWKFLFLFSLRCCCCAGQQHFVRKLTLQKLWLKKFRYSFSSIKRMLTHTQTQQWKEHKQKQWCIFLLLLIFCPFSVFNAINATN